MRCNSKEVTSRANIKTELKKCGDLGDIAVTCKSKQKLIFPPPPLTVRSLYKDFRSIAEMEVFLLYAVHEQGSKSQDRKMGVIKRLMVAARGEEIKYIIRGLQGKLRVGLAEQSVISALAQAVVLTPGIPVQPMLAKPTKGISEVLDRLQGREFTCEYKYDGERAQVGVVEACEG